MVKGVLDNKMDYKDLNDFLLSYPGMSIRPSNINELVLEGKFTFVAKVMDGIEIEDCYELMMFIPQNCTSKLPRVFEIGNRIPRDGKHHINPDDSICLGSPLRLLEIINRRPTLIGFVEDCLIPYLYAISIKMKFGDDFIFGELAHGVEGIIDDYLDLFNLETRGQLIESFELIRMKRRHANKQKCPCGCDNLLGKCKFNLKIIKYRKIIPKEWLK